MTARYDELLRRLVAAQVRFVLVGGLALGAWGAIRATKEVDVVADPDPENLQRPTRVLVEVDGRVHLGDAFVSSPLGLAAALRGDDRVLVQTSLGDLGVVRGLPGVLPYETLAARAVPVELLGTEVAVCSLEHLRAMKRAAGRPQDLVDLESRDVAHPAGEA